MAGKGKQWVQGLLVAACLFAVYFLGVANLKAEPISHSEWNSQQHLFKTYLDPAYTVAQTLDSVSQHSAQHGPLYFVLLNIWQKFAGRDLFSLRLLSIFFSILSIACAYQLASISRDRDIATIAAILLAFVAYLIFYAQIVRMYSLLLLFVAIVAWAYWKAISTAKAPSAWGWALLVLSSAALIYVHYYGIIVLAAIGLYHILFAAKDKRWLQVCAAMIVAGFAFVPWLPVVLRGWTELRIPSENLTLFESIVSVAQVYSNGLAPILVVALAACLLRFRLLNAPKRYLLFLALSMLLMIIILNEFTPVLAARRLRYTIILAVPLICSIAIGLTLLPARQFAIPALVGLWILGCFVYADSDELNVFTNRKYQNSDAVPSYQDFRYQAESLPSRNALILSFHPDTMVDDYKVLAYYRWVLSDWAHVAHITYDAAGDLVIQSGLSTYAALDAIVDNSNSIWVIHNPQQTDLNALEVYRNWFTQHFEICHRFIDTERSFIEYFVKKPIPCSLIAGGREFEIIYDNGTWLGGAEIAQKPDQLAVYLWWLQSDEGVYAYSLQVFDEHREKVQQLDVVISGDPVDARALDISSLPAGSYSVDLIVYDRQTGAGQSGTLVSENRTFERAVELYRFVVES